MKESQIPPIKKTKSPFYCPRCQSRDLVFSETTFRCMQCHLEFDITDYQMVEDKSGLLSTREKQKIFEILELDTHEY
ncbi:MAG: hypothetical protein EU544_05620 [Promethearchaeota archaeon]|nr:MAG: hypothetical protein EU544_05620 [Candidatus Lokiarchaeota archaeon]